VTLDASKNQLQFQQQLMTLFQQQFANQKGVLDFLQGTLKPELARAQAGEGFSDKALAAMRTSATDTTASEFQNAQAALNQTLKTSAARMSPRASQWERTRLFLPQKRGHRRESESNHASECRTSTKQLLETPSTRSTAFSAQINPLGYGGEASGAGGTVASLSDSQSKLQDALTSAGSNSFFGKAKWQFRQLFWWWIGKNSYYGRGRWRIKHG